VFDEAILKPDTQDLGCFVDGVKNICEAQQRVARQYFEDGSVRELCPPLKVLMSILAFGSHDGMTAHDPEVRRMFTREYLLGSDWYRQRLETKQRRDVALWRRHGEYLRAFLARPTYADEARRLGIEQRLRLADAELERTSSPAYLQSLVGTLGAHPFNA
jgi:phosphoenolpyruvate carboxykinase (diphosphate)